MTRENLGVWLDWHTRLEGLMLRDLTTLSDVSSADRKDFPRLLVARTRLSLFGFVSQSPYSVRFVALNILARSLVYWLVKSKRSWNSLTTSRPTASSLRILYELT